jgi:hypothetical protein
MIRGDKLSIMRFGVLAEKLLAQNTIRGIDLSKPQKTSLISQMML